MKKVTTIAMGVFLGLVLCVVVGLVMCSVPLAMDSPKSSPTLVLIDEYRAPRYSVRYEVIGTASAASLCWENSQGGTEMGDYKLPFRETWTFEKGDFAYISAQNLGETGSITCQIWVNGVKWKESTSTGAYSIATCSGSVGRE